MAGKISTKSTSTKKSSSSKTRSSLFSSTTIKPKVNTPKIRTKTQKEAQKSRDSSSRDELNLGEEDFRKELMNLHQARKGEITELPKRKIIETPQELAKGGDALGKALNDLIW